MQNTWGAGGALTDYATAVSYDGNGNITDLQRNGIAAVQTAMDDFDYHYTAGTNRLDYVTDNATDNAGYDDIKQGQNSGNYTYDATGRLISDVSEEIGNIEWTHDSKIAAIKRTQASTKPELEFFYDESRNRIAKLVKPRAGGSVDPTGADWTYTFYVYDAGGNVLATYTKTYDQVDQIDRLHLSENFIYGSKRLGQERRDLLVAKTGAITLVGDAGKRKLGMRTYECANHLGNVLATISDRKIGVAANSSDLVVDYYEADVLSYSDYYPFGMQMPGRNGGGDYRYGFQGQETDDEITGSKSHIAYKYRCHDARLGRFLSIDPLAPKYPHNSPYAFSENRLIDGVELEGLEFADIKVIKDVGGNIVQRVITYRDVIGPNTGIMVHVYQLDEDKNESFVETQLFEMIKPPTVNSFKKQLGEVDQAYVNAIVAHVSRSSKLKTGIPTVNNEDIIPKDPNFSSDHNYGNHFQLIDSRKSGISFFGKVNVIGSFENSDPQEEKQINIEIRIGALYSGAAYSEKRARAKRQILTSVYSFDVSKNRDGSDNKYWIRLGRPNGSGGISNGGSVVNLLFDTKEDRSNFVKTYLNDAKKISVGI